MPKHLARVKPFIVGSDSAKDFLHVGADILRNRGRALDAVAETCKAVGVDGNLVTSRFPPDMPVWMPAILERLR
ncbi:MAG: hypothetical protein V1924_01730 [Candidatus Bathyarchaeota archaeon]